MTMMQNYHVVIPVWWTLITVQLLSPLIYYPTLKPNTVFSLRKVIFLGSSSVIASMMILLIGQALQHVSINTNFLVILMSIVPVLTCFLL